MTEHYTVLGASGFIGRHLVASLQSRDLCVWAPERGGPEIFARPLGHVIYCIGLTADFRSRPFDTVRAHVSVLAELLERANFDSLLYLSSTRVYAGLDVAQEGASLMVNPENPSDLYNLSKLMGESLCLSCERGGVRVARLSNVVGCDPNSDNFLFALIREARGGQIVLRSDLDSSKDYILLDDVLTLLPRIAVSGRERIYNVAGGGNIRHRELAGRLVELTGCALDILPAAPRQCFPTIDIKRIRAEFDFVPSSVLDALPALLA